MKIPRWLACIVFWTCIAVSPLWAAEAPTLDNVKVHKDEAGAMSPPAALSLFDSGASAQPQHFPTPYPAAQPDEAAWWLHATMRNRSAVPLPVVLSLDDTHIDAADFYLERDGQWTHPAVSDTQRYPLVMLTLAPHEQVPVLIRMTSKEVFRLRPAVRTVAAWNTLQRRAALWDGVLFGGLIALAWSAFLIAAFSRNRAFFLLAAMCVGITIFEAAFRGYPHVYLWHASRQFDIRVSHLAGYATLVVFVAFVLAIAKEEDIRLPGRRLLIVFAWLEGFGAIGNTFWNSWFFTHFDIWLHGAINVFILVVTALFVIRRTPTAKLMLATVGFSLFNLLARLSELTASWGLTPAIPWLGHDIYPNPAIALMGLATHLVVLAAWLRHIGQQRSEARQKLVQLQQTEQDRLRNEVQLRTAELDRALADAREKNRQKIEMVSYIGHDLRAPLATISGYLKLIDNATASSRPELIHAINRSVTYQLSLIDELLEYTRAEMVPLDIRPRAAELPALLANIAEYAVALCSQQDNVFVYRVATPIPVNVEIDSTRIQQVLLNLLSNASKFTREGSVSLTVEVIEHHAADHAWRLGFSIADTGVGMDLSEATDIFGAYRQLHHGTGGAGLGLFIAQRLVTAMGGKLRVESTPAQGSRFSFDIVVVALDGALAEPTTQSWPVFPTPTHVEAASGEAPASDHPLSPAAIRELEQLAREGRLTDIERWMNELADTTHGLAFVAKLRAYLDRLDFSGLERFAISLQRRRT
jgi:signal transduction histidine kinase